MSETLISILAIVTRTIIFVLTAMFAVRDSSSLSYIWRIIILAIGMVAWTITSMVEWRLLG